MLINEHMALKLKKKKKGEKNFEYIFNYYIRGCQKHLMKGINCQRKLSNKCDLLPQSEHKVVGLYTEIPVNAKKQ